ncbi:ParB/RepB/Spo0J family partition protein [Candidatus Neomarinimicrobiota bacterium]
MAKQRLGKGLDALIPGGTDNGFGAGGQPHIAVELIDPNPFQPRKEFRDEDMADLINSINSKGILQALTVRSAENGRYELVAGERRLRAAKAIGLDKVPAYILSIGTDIEMMEMALIENIQRSDLNPVEEAEAFALLHSKYDYTQERIAKQVGMSRPAVANYLRILRLPTEIKDSLIDRSISMGHARALLGLPQQALMTSLWRKIMDQGLSVRQTEAAVQDLAGDIDQAETKSAKKNKPKDTPDRSAFIDQVEQELLGRLGTKVRLKQKKNDTGQIEIGYYSHDDLQRILEIIVGDEVAG